MIKQTLIASAALIFCASNVFAFGGKVGEPTAPLQNWGRIKENEASQKKMMNDYDKYKSRPSPRSPGKTYMKPD